MPPGVAQKSVSFTVPEGKRLVIESISVGATLASGQTLASAIVQAHVNKQLERYYLRPTFTGTQHLSGIQDTYSATDLVKIYADGGDDVVIYATVGGVVGEGVVDISVQGYLLDCKVAICE